MKKKNFGGRPKLKRGTDKAAVIAFRLLTSERKELEAAAKRDGARLSDWVRKTLLKVAKNGTIYDAEPEDAGIEPHGGTGRGLGM